ncbi:hypothetical protein AX16_004687 [Volvariella volvacea WC 439]|nr:hypothetical protein AX16_004687 [Volvariella volvacea WC 439]
MSQDVSLFVASLSLWMRDDYQNLIDRLQRVLNQNPNYPRNTLEWRTDTVTDYRGYPVPDSAERLIHWTDVHPDVIFAHGLVPREVEPALDRLSNASLDLGAYVQDSSAAHSVFVSTTRYHRTEDGRNQRWMPRNPRRFEYEIFAHGGIDVNLSLGSRSPWRNQREIAFPGGIRPEFIRSAREYEITTDPETGRQSSRVIRLWVNCGFDPTANGPRHSARLVEFPDPVCQSSIEVVYWPRAGEGQPTPPPQGHDPGEHELRRRRDVSRQQGDAMNEEGSNVDDTLMTGNCPATPPRAVLPVPDESNQAYFFAFDQYVRIKFAPGRVDDTIVLGPKLIVHEWPSLRKAGFGKVDAALPSPNGNGEVYFFSGTRYALIKVKPGTTDDYIINGPKDIASEWPSLRKAGFNKVDAAFISPTKKSEAYFFSGTRYALIKIVPGTTDDYIINGPKSIVSEWPSLRNAGFSMVDAVLPSPNGNGETYFFSGNRYALIRVIPGTTDDYVINGPKTVATEWPSLKQAGFY